MANEYRISAFYVEGLVSNPGAVRVSSAYAEALVVYPAVARVTSMYVEVLRSIENVTIPTRGRIGQIITLR